MSVLQAAKYAWLQNVLHNGIGRYVCQLQRLTLQFSKTAGASRGVRDYIEEDVVEFANRNQQVVVYITPHQKYQSPKIVAEFLNGNVRKIDLRGKEREEVKEAMELLRTQSGVEIIKIKKPFRTQHPSVQGVWNPFTHKPSHLNLESFPTDNPTYDIRKRGSSSIKPEVLKELRRLQEGKQTQLEAGER